MTISCSHLDLVKRDWTGHVDEETKYPMFHVWTMKHLIMLHVKSHGSPLCGSPMN